VHAAAGTATDAARSVAQEDEQAPERNEVEPPFELVVVRRTWLVAAAAAGTAVLARHHLGLDVSRRTLARHDPDVRVHKVLEPVDVIE
jgi:hypothetical protein